MLAYYMLQQWKRQISDSCFYQKLHEHSFRKGWLAQSSKKITAAHAVCESVEKNVYLTVAVETVLLSTVLFEL